MSTPEQIIRDYVYDPDVRKPDHTADSIAKGVIDNLKYEGYIIVNADALAKSVSAAMAGVQSDD